MEHEDVVLIVLPGDEPTTAIATFRKQCPTAKAIYYKAPAPTGGTVKIEQHVPTGRLPFKVSKRHD